MSFRLHRYEIQNRHYQVRHQLHHHSYDHHHHHHIIIIIIIFIVIIIILTIITIVTITSIIIQSFCTCLATNFQKFRMNH